jgi:hypothetical protein
MNPDLRAHVTEMLLDPGRRKTYKDIANETSVHVSTIKSIATKLRNNPAESGNQLTSTIAIIRRECFRNFERACEEPKFDSNVISSNLNPEFPLEEVDPKILQDHTVKEYTAEETQRLKQKHARESRDYHGIWSYPVDQQRVQSVRNFKEVLERPENKSEFKAIFQVSQPEVHSELLAYLTSRESSTASNDVLADASTALEDGGSKNKKRKRTQEQKDEERCGDHKRKHVIMTEWLALVRKRIKNFEQKLKSLQKQIRAETISVQQFHEQIGIMKRSTISAKSTRSLNAEQAKDSDPAQDGRLQNLEARLRETQVGLDKHQLDEQELSGKLEQETKALKLTHDVIAESGLNYKRIIQTSPYHGIVEGSLNENKLLSIILSEMNNKSQGAHADSKYKGGSILQAIGRKQYLIVFLNGFKAMRILKRMVPHRASLLEMIRTKLVDNGISPDWLREHFNEVRIWNFLCSLQLERELRGPIRPVLWPVEEGAFLLVDNLTPHAGAPNNGPDAFRLHMYAYLRAVDERINDDDEDQLITIDLLLEEYRSVCEHIQRSARERGDIPVFWSPA